MSEGQMVVDASSIAESKEIQMPGQLVEEWPNGMEPAWGELA